MATPLSIQIGLHYYCSSVTDFQDGNFGYPAVRQEIDAMLHAGLLEEVAGGPSGTPRYQASDGLRIWVETLCAVRWPVQKWVISNSGFDELAAEMTRQGDRTNASERERVA